MLDRIRPLWPLIVLLGSGGLLAGAHAFQRFGGLPPCPMCLDQREFHWAVAALAVTGFAVLRFWPKGARIVAAVLGLALLAAGAKGLEHVAVEQGWITGTCTAGADLGDIQAFDPNATFVAPTCDEPAWTMFGVSLAGYNAIASFALALMSFAVAFWPRRHG